MEKFRAVRHDLNLGPPTEQQQIHALELDADKRRQEAQKEVQEHAKERNAAEVRRQQIEKQKAAKQKRVAKLELHPTKKLVQLEKIMTPLWTDAYLAVLDVDACGLRSDYWVDSIINGVQATGQHELRKFRLNDDEISAASHFRAIIYNRIMQRSRSNGIRKTCSMLVNSDILKNMDKLQYQLTGGYH